MSRQFLYSAAGTLLLLATQQAHAETMSCSFTSEDQGIIGTSVGSNGGSNVFEIDDFSFGVEQPLNTGSEGSGAGAGKVTFNPFEISGKVDKSTPQLLQMAARGSVFKTVSCSFYRAETDGVSPSPFLTVVLTDAVIEKFKIDGQNDGTQRASFWFAYERIEWKVN